MTGDFMASDILMVLRIGLVGLLAVGQTAAYGDDDSPLELELEVGAEYDENITIDAIDSNARQGDSILRLSGAIGTDILNKDDTSLSVRYSIFQSLHQDLTDFDLQLHGFSTRGNTKVGKVNVGVDYRYDYIRLAGDDFMDVHTVGTDIGWLVAAKTYLTAGYEFRTQSFDDPTRSERNADRHSADAKLFFLLGQGRNITTGYKVSRQTAGVDSLSYWGHTADAGLKLPVKLIADETVFRLRYQYRHKDYSGIDPDIGEKRADRRHTFRAIFEIPFAEKFAVNLEYKYVISNSNLPSVDYDGSAVRASIGWTF